ncbi:MAG: dTDP-4-dehydrorhamnose 3,5-epimerase [Gammaproteobacteria bacterium]|nr:dTDP-4-dehydrorhamnose 3,5-epimerase [Gammaproteobacteria bacterium]MBU1624481.1 dTDP-4-dehydrorhamnose 3,5-epimerase [Gammaproteobacteria bacterium]MBU1982325.1 dTDP-4-dehydrorhamnose 3,5-epimerase [Gammaproteobacteria bacterium]
MKTTSTELAGVLILEPKVFGDQRGYFMETWNQAAYEAAGIKEAFVQDNLSFSKRGILRGLHFQKPNTQGKLVYVLQGEVFDVIVDIRVGSPSFGKAINVTLSADNKRQVYIPPGFAHGFCVTSDYAMFAYKCTDRYNPQAEASVLWNDPDLDILWPVSEPELSAKDKDGMPLKDFAPERLPQYEG